MQRCIICNRQFQDDVYYGKHLANFVTINGKIVGEIDEVKRIYITRRTPNEHFYVKGKGYPISVKILNDLFAKGIERILIIEENRKDNEIKYYQADLTDYLSQPTFQEGIFDPQKCLPLAQMVEL